VMVETVRGSGYRFTTKAKWFSVKFTNIIIDPEH
jgi:DNA-binding winged helix-turn-helix (wHTH) protein